jgi:hypothetical protein
MSSLVPAGSLTSALNVIGLQDRAIFIGQRPGPQHSISSAHASAGAGTGGGD